MYWKRDFGHSNVLQDCDKVKPITEPQIVSLEAAYSHGHFGMLSFSVGSILRSLEHFHSYSQIFSSLCMPIAIFSARANFFYADFDLTNVS